MQLLQKNQIRTVDVERMSHEGRGIAMIDGQSVFVDGALVGERIQIRLLGRKKKIWHAQVESIETASPDRRSPSCQFYDWCGGCSLQHMSIAAQQALKQNTLQDQLRHFGQCNVPTLAPLIQGQPLGYRKKARLGVKFVAKKNKVLVGFREKNSPYLTEMSACQVLDPRVGLKIEALQALVGGLQARQTIPQIEVAASADEVALIFRHLEPLSDSDLAQLIEFCQNENVQLFLQPGRPDSVHRVWPEDDGQPSRLHYSIDGLKLNFHPTDFTQVNAEVNEQMVAQAIDWLDLKPTDQVLDLFCGLGNFTLPLAKRVRHVVGVEGSQAMVDRGYENARLNGLSNCEFHALDLTGDFLGLLDQCSWDLAQGELKVLLDPPRSGAEAVVQQLCSLPVTRIVYVSCNPATLARDTAILQAGGFKCVQAGMLDMFPHTPHIESMALFEK